MPRPNSVRKRYVPGDLYAVRSGHARGWAIVLVPFSRTLRPGWDDFIMERTGEEVIDCYVAIVGNMANRPSLGKRHLTVGRRSMPVDELEAT